MWQQNIKYLGISWGKQKTFYAGFFLKFIQHYWEKFQRPKSMEKYTMFFYWNA